MLSDSAITLLLQVPLAGVVVFVVVLFLKYIKEITANYITHIAHEAETNREFLKLQGDRLDGALARLAEEIKSIRTDSVKETAEIKGMLRPAPKGSKNV